jgi:signal peptidase II
MKNQKIGYGNLFFFVTLIIIFLDQLSKLLIKIYQPRLDWGLFKIVYLTNTGAGFGILQGHSFYLGLFSLAIALLIIINYKEIPKQKSYQIYSALLLGGIIGNMIDRLFRNYVIDFIHFIFPPYNVADICINLGIWLIILTYIIEKIKN